MNYLKIDELKDGHAYYIHARNANIGIWSKTRKAFTISRHKFGNNYLFDEFHWDTGAPHGTVKPEKEIEKSPYIPDQDTIIKFTDTHFYPGGGLSLIEKEDEILEYLNKLEEKFVTIADLINRILFTQYKSKKGDLCDDKHWIKLRDCLIKKNVYFTNTEELL